MFHAVLTVLFEGDSVVAETIAGGAGCAILEDMMAVGVDGGGPLALACWEAGALIVMLGIIRFVTPYFASALRDELWLL
jgi:hypothetical protein